MYRHVNSIYDSNLGKQLLQEQLPKVFSKCFGYYLLCLGETGTAEWLKGCPVRYAISVNPKGRMICPRTIQGSYTDLPIQSSSIDVAFLPHLLDNEKNPELILQEIWRVLIPGGTLVVMGVNPYSFLGIKYFTRLLSLSGLSRHLKNLQFEMIEKNTFFFQPIPEEIGKKWCANRGGIYLLTAKKQVVSMTPIETSAWMKRWEKITRPVTAQPVICGTHDKKTR